MSPKESAELLSDLKIEKADSPFLVQLLLTIPAETVEAAFQEVFESSLQRVRMKGFRKGKVPSHIVKRHLQDEALRPGVISKLANPAFQEALRRADLRPLGQPEWQVTQCQRGEPMQMEVTLQTLPLLSLDGYRPFQLDRPRPAVQESDVEAELHRLRARYASFKELSLDRPAQPGDHALMDYRLDYPGNPVQGRKIRVELAAGQVAPGFVEGVLGGKAGEERQFRVHPPESEGEIDCTVTLHRLYSRKLPRLTDRMVRENKLGESVEGLKAQIRTRLEARLQEQEHNAVANEIVKVLVEQIQPEQVPPQLREGHSKLALRNRTLQLEKIGKTVEQHIKERGLTPQLFAQELSLLGYVEARLEILYRSLAKAENLVVTEGEVDQEIVRQSQWVQATPSQLKEQLLNQDRYKLLAYQLLIAKVRQFLVSQARYQEPPEPAPKSKAKTPRTRGKTKSKAKKSSSRAKAKSKVKTSRPKAKKKSKKKA